MAIDAEILKTEYPKFHGFKDISEYVIMFISQRFEMDEIKSITRVKGTTPQQDWLDFKFTDGHSVISNFRDHKRQAYIEFKT